MVAPTAVVREVLGCVPQLLGDTEEELSALVETVKQLISADRTLMLPAIGVLGEVALPEALKPELARLALGALPLADELDLPTLVRCARICHMAKAGRTLRSLQAHMGTVSSGTLLLLLHVVANTLRVNGGMARALLTQCGATALSLGGRSFSCCCFYPCLAIPLLRQTPARALCRALLRCSLRRARRTPRYQRRRSRGCWPPASSPTHRRAHLPTDSARRRADSEQRRRWRRWRWRRWRRWRRWCQRQRWRRRQR